MKGTLTLGVTSPDPTAPFVATAAESEPLARAVLEVLDEGVIVIDTRGRLVQANPAATAILGLDLPSALADPDWWQALAARSSNDGSNPDIGATVLKTGRGVRDVEVEVDRPDGTRALLWVNSLPLRDDTGAIAGLVLSFRDVTEHGREHRRLVATEERLREAHSVARLASWEWDPETNEVVVFHALVGNESMVETRTPHDAIMAQMPAAERRQARDDLDALVRDEVDETRRRLKQATPAGPLWVETRSRAIRDGDGRLICVRGTSQDITEEELARQEAALGREFLQATLDSLPAHVAVIDATGEIVMTNRAWADFGHVNGATTAAVCGNYLAACDGAPDDESAARTAAGLRSLMTEETTELSLEYPCHSPTAERWFELRAARFRGTGETRVVVAHTDVTQRRQVERQVATQAALLDEVDVAVVAIDLEGRITQWNRGAERLYGWAGVEAVGRRAGELMVPEGDDRAAEIVAELRRVGHWEGEYTVRRKDGSTFPAFVRDRLMLDGDGQPAGMIGVSVDISERVASERALHAARNYLLAVADGMGDGLLTLDLEGRLIYLNSAAERLLGWPLAELEGRVFNHVAHTHRPDGSELAGDDCPIARAGRESRTVRVDDDVFNRREGGRLPVAYTAAPFETEDGVAGCVVVFEDITERKAREETLARDADKLLWIGRIQDALATDQFVLHGQPIVDLADGATVQCELLLRLREPDGTIVGPGAYLHIAEESGLISEIDRWVIRRGVEVAATGRAVEINLSARSVGDQAILAHIEHCLAASDADPSLVVFEITETAIVADADAARLFADRLREIGCKLALDDFGTGYGGFTYLKQLPVDSLKIDIEFVRDLVTNPGSRHVVEAVVALARGFGLQTVAEGVEDAETYALLRELGVDFAQGYHIARPAPLDL